MISIIIFIPVFIVAIAAYLWVCTQDIDKYPQSYDDYDSKGNSYDNDWDYYD